MQVPTHEKFGNAFAKNNTTLCPGTGERFGDRRTKPHHPVRYIASPAGTDLSLLCLFDPYDAYFISAGPSNPEEPVPDETLFINVLSCPEAPML
jgi:hypothetical protein